MKLSYKIAFLHVMIILIILDFTSCKSEVSEPVSDIEAQYFEDYIEPDYKWGFINRSGRPTIEAIYDDVRDARSNLIAANYKGKWGYIDQNGKTKIEHRYKQVLDFSENRSFVQDFNHNWK